MRRLNVRTQKEIDLEITALKVIRGDFNTLVGKQSTAEEIVQTLQR